MDYRSNEDYYPHNRSRGALFNGIIDILFVEGSSAPDEPATVAEARQQGIIDESIMDDNLLEAYITTARQQCEDYTGISFLQREIIAVLNNSLGGIYLPYGPVQSIRSVQNEAGDNIEADSYNVTGVAFKQLKTPVSDYVKITYSAGFDVLPKVFKTALLQQVVYLYEHRGDEKADTFSPIAKSLLKPHRRVW